MNFEEAVQAHVDWKTKLRSHLTKKDTTLKPIQIASDKICALGQWIYGEGKKYNNLPEYKSLVETHAQFHIHTAQIVELINSGEVKKAEDMLQAGSDFMKLSGQCVNWILQIKNKTINK